MNPDSTKETKETKKTKNQIDMETNTLEYCYIIQLVWCKNFVVKMKNAKHLNGKDLTFNL
jgi:hypothetical protein